MAMLNNQMVIIPNFLPEMHLVCDLLFIALLIPFFSTQQGYVIFTIQVVEGPIWAILDTWLFYGVILALLVIINYPN